MALRRTALRIGAWGPPALVAAALLLGRSPAGASDSAARAPASPPGARPFDDPTVHGGRLVPAAAATPSATPRARALADADPRRTATLPGSPPVTIVGGVEAGGGLRALAAGLRIVVRPGGVVTAADAPFSATPSLVVPLPARLGGGFLFLVGAVIHRAPSWLAPARAIVNSASSIAAIMAGLDRVYARAPSGTYQAFDPRTGEARDLGAFPRGPFVRSYAAADGWRAAAIVDLRGVLSTQDAGATWRPLDLPIDAREVRAEGDLLVIEGDDAAHARRAFALNDRGQLSETSPSPERASTAPRATPAAPPKGVDSPGDAARSPFGARPLEAAVEDGWPLGDGTAVVARDGALARVRLKDGALTSMEDDAYPLGPSRCHPVPLAPAAPAAVTATWGSAAEARLGFICGVSQGPTVLYAYLGAYGGDGTGRLVEERRWGSPRLAVPSSLGGLAIRGGCAADAPDSPARYCVRRAGGAWGEERLAWAEQDARVATFPDGRLAILTPPHDGAPATLTWRAPHGDGGDHPVPLAWPPLDEDRRDALQHGTWLVGFETRAGDRLGGWVETYGSRLGLDLSLDGEVRVGPLVRDLGAPMVSGRYGLGFSASRRAYETDDGGLTWTFFEVPEPLVSGRFVATRACGPIGCNAAGWLRIGWGPVPGDDAAAPLASSVPPVHFPSSRNNVAVSLACTAVGTESALSAVPGASPSPSPSPPPPPGRAKFAIVVRPGAPVTITTPLALPPPPPGPARPFVLEVDALFDRAAKLGPVARVRATPSTSALGPVTWHVEWTHLPGGSTVRRSQLAAAPAWLSDLVQPGALSLPASVPLASLAPGDDPDHALLMIRRGSRAEPDLYALEAGRPPAPIHRGDGGPFGEIEAALRVSGRWYLAATGEGASPGPVTQVEQVVFEVDGTSATERVRVPRVSLAGRATASGGLRLGQRHHGEEIDLVVEGAALAERVGATRWALPIDRASGRVSPPELLGSADLGDRSDLPLCGEETRRSGTSLVLDAPLAVPLALAVAGSGLGATSQDWGPLHAAFGRLRFEGQASSPVCLEAVSGVVEPAATPLAVASFDPLSSIRVASGAVAPAAGRGDTRAVGGSRAGRASEARVSVLAGDRRTRLRCERQ